MMSQYASGAALVLRVYAGCVFSASPWTGALVLAATAFSPFSCLLGLLSVSSALACAYALGLVSERNVPSVYTYGALFLGLSAEPTFAQPMAALAVATFGAAAAALLTASVREISLRFGLPSLSLPFLFVYSSAISAARALGQPFSAPAVHVSSLAAALPWQVRFSLEALGAVLCNARAEVGALVLAALFATSVHAVVLALLGLAVSFAAILGLGLGPALHFTITLNTLFTALGLGMGWYAPSPRSYLRAAIGASLCALITPSFGDVFGRLELSPLGLPFTVSIYAVLLLEQRPATRARAFPKPSPDPEIAWGMSR